MGTRVLGSEAISPGHIYVVDKYGNGDYDTIQSAINAAHSANPAPSAASRWLILVAPGEYTEALTLYDYIDIAGNSPDKSAYLHKTGNSCILNGADCTISNLRVLGDTSPMITTGASFAGKTLRLVDIVLEDSTDGLIALQVQTGICHLYDCLIQSGGRPVYVKVAGIAKVFYSRLIRYHAGAASDARPVVDIEAGLFEAYNCDLSNLAPDGEAVKFTAVPAVTSKLINSVLRKSAAATYSVAASASSPCLIAGCLANSDPDVAVLSDCVDWLTESDL